MNRKELGEKVNLAYDEYFNNITYLGNKFDIMPPSSRNVSKDARTKVKAARLWEDFQVRRTEAQR